MGIANSQVRQRAIDAYVSGKGTQKQVAKLYGVDLSTFQRWLQRYRHSGRAEPLPRGHNPPALNEAQMQQLNTLVQQSPDATLEQLRHTMGLSCSIVAVHNALKRLGYRYKKKRYEPANKIALMLRNAVKNGARNKAPSISRVSCFWTNPGRKQI